MPGVASIMYKSMADVAATSISMRGKDRGATHCATTSSPTITTTMPSQTMILPMPRKSRTVRP